MSVNQSTQIRGIRFSSVEGWRKTLRLVPELPEEYAAKLKSVRYQAAVLVILVLNRPLTPFYWLNISDPEIPFVAVVEQTNFVPASLYGGKHLVYLSNYCYKGDFRAVAEGQVRGQL